MSADKTGEDLEASVYRYIEQTLVPTSLGIRRENVLVSRKKRYWSARRKSFITVDISVEIFQKDAPAPSLIWIWECKDYAGDVPVNDVEEFDSKLSQIGEHNTKGTMVSRNGFQAGAIELAKSLGIGLSVFISDNRLAAIYYAGAPHVQAKALEAMAKDSKTEFRCGGISVTGKFFVFNSPTDYIATELFSFLAHPNV
jgi:hypothetical protein